MKKIIGILVSLSVLTVIFLKIDIVEFARNFKSMDPIFFAVSLFFSLPQTLISAKRWQMILGSICRITLWESIGLILAGSTLNVILPSKMGDMAKAFFLKKTAALPLKKGLSLNIIEKALDVGGLSVVLLIGALFIPQNSVVIRFSIFFSFFVISVVFMMFSFNLAKIGLTSKIRLGKKINDFLDGWQESIASQRGEKTKFLTTIFFSLFLWFLHITQIYFFFLSLNSSVSPLVVYTYVPLAIFIGLLPVSFGGIGTRDAALIYLFSPYESASRMAGIGLLCSMRYFIPALAGLPFFHRFGFKSQEIRREIG